MAELKTFNGKSHLVEAPLNSKNLLSDDTLTIKVKDNSKNTYIDEKTIPVDNVETNVNLFEVEVETEIGSVDNPYSLNFKSDFDGNLIPRPVIYKIYEIREFPTEDTKSLVAQFTITPFFYTNTLAYTYRIDKHDENRVELDFNGSRENYPNTGNLTFTVTELETEFLSYTNSKVERTIGMSYGGVFENLFDKNLIKEGFTESVEENLSVGDEDTNGFISIINQKITESERFLKFGVINDTGENLIVTNWVDGGVLNQVDEEIEPLGSLVLKMYDSALPLSIKDTVIFSELYANDIIFDVDLSEGEEGFQLRRLTPNFQKEVEDNTISAFGDYQSFNELTLSGSALQDRIVDYFLQKKQESVGLNTDFTNFNNFVKFGSAEEQLVNFHYKVTELERLTAASASLSSSVSTADSTGSVTLPSGFSSNRITDIEENIRSIRNGFDEYELFLFNDSGSLYEDKPYVSSSANVYASWPKNTPTELITNGGFDTTADWNVNGTNTSTTTNQARIFKGGEVSQSITLTPNREYVLEFDVKNSGLPVSFEYNGKVVINETIPASGSNEFRFSTRNLKNSTGVLSIKGADYGNTTRFTDIDNVSLKQPPELLSSTNQTVKDWFSTFRDIAKDYDAKNVDSLKNNTPEYIRADSQNSDYILFLAMIGQMFDEIWLYGNELGNLYDWDSSIKEGLSEDLSIVLLEAYGNNLDVGFSEKDVWEYILGVDSNEDELGREIGFSFERRQKETIRRLLTNLPYFLKNKGTSRSIKGLVVSYGIPLSTMFIREYGTFQGSNALESIFNREKETKKLDMNNGTISATGSFLNTSNAIEMNFQSLENVGSTFTLVSGSNPDGFEISVKSEGGDSGSILLSIDGSNVVSSSAGPIYNGEFWNVITQRTNTGAYEVRAYQFNRDDGTFDYQLSGSVVAPVSASFHSGSLIEAHSFNGYVDEFRVWDAEISEANFIEHVKFPSSIKLSDPLQIPEKLLARVDIDTDTSQYVVDSDGKIPNLVFNPQYPTQLTASGFTVDDFVTYTRTDYINSTNVGNEKLGNNKVRYQIAQSLNGGVLTPNFGDNTDSNDQLVTGVSPVTFNPPITTGGGEITIPNPDGIDGTLAGNELIYSVDDSYKLTIGFSPTDITNEIILQHFGGNDLLDEFGDPTNVYDERYPELEQTVESFFENISTNKKAKFFIEYIRNFDKTLFENIKRFVPERADLSTSIFIEPHYLNRSKAKRLGKSQTEDLYKVGNEVEDTYTVSSTSNTEENTDNPLVTTDEETLVAKVLSEMNGDSAVTVISQDEVTQYLNQSTDVIILQDGFESQVLRNNVWESDSSITVTNDYGETFKFKVYKFDYSAELADLESQIGNYVSTNNLGYFRRGIGRRYEIDRRYQDLTRLWQQYYDLHNTLFLLKFEANPIDNAVLVTYEDLPQSLKEDLVLSSGTKSINEVVFKNGITLIISEDTVDGGPVVETTRTTDTKTIVDDPDGSVKLTVE